MRHVKIRFTGNKENFLELQLNDNEIMTLKEWIINETPTLFLQIEESKNEILLFRSHIVFVKIN